MKNIKLHIFILGLLSYSNHTFPAKINKGGVKFFFKTLSLVCLQALNKSLDASTVPAKNPLITTESNQEAIAQIEEPSLLPHNTSCSLEKPLATVQGGDGTVFIYRHHVLKTFHKKEYYFEELNVNQYLDSVKINRIKMLDYNNDYNLIQYERFKTDLRKMTDQNSKSVCTDCGCSQKLSGAQLAKDKIAALSKDLITLHKNLITHNDIHPGNLALKQDESLSFSDFGKAIILKQKHMEAIASYIPASRRVKLKKKLETSLKNKEDPELSDLLHREDIRLTTKPKIKNPLSKLVQKIMDLEASEKCDRHQFKVFFPTAILPPSELSKNLAINFLRFL